MKTSLLQSQPLLSLLWPNLAVACAESPEKGHEKKGLDRRLVPARYSTAGFRITDYDYFYGKNRHPPFPFIYTLQIIVLSGAYREVMRYEKK